MKVFQLIEFLKLCDPQADSQSVLRSIFPSMDTRGSSDEEEASEKTGFPDAAELAMILDGSCLPLNCSTTSVGWLANGNNSLEFDDNEGGYDYRCEIDLLGDYARVSFGQETVKVSSVEELVDSIQEYWGIGSYCKHYY